MEPISDKIKKYLQRKLEDCEKNLRKQKRKRKRIKTLYITTILLSILISGVVATVSMLPAPIILLVPVLSSFSAILTAISSRFNFQNKKAEIKTLIDKLNKIQSKLDYVISCNGDLTPDEYQQILKDF